MCKHSVLCWWISLDKSYLQIKWFSGPYLISEEFMPGPWHWIQIYALQEEKEFVYVHFSYWKGKKQFSLQVNPDGPLGLSTTVVESHLLTRSWLKIKKKKNNFFSYLIFYLFTTSSYLLWPAPGHDYSCLDEELSRALWQFIFCRCC